MNNSPKESLHFLGIQWESWNAEDFLLNFIVMTSTVIIIFGGYLVTKSLITGKWKRRLDNWLEFSILMSLVIFISKIIMKRICFH